MELVDIECELYRLIPSRFPPVSVFDGLVANDRLDQLAEIEARTNPRLQSDERLRALYGDSGSPQLQNWNLAPFKYLNPEGSRFFPSTWPALELSDDQQTALAVAVARREGFLRRTSEAALGLDMRMLKTPVAGKFADLSEVSPNLEREKRWEIARDLPEAADGIIYCPLSDRRTAATRFCEATGWGEPSRRFTIVLHGTDRVFRPSTPLMKWAEN
ncbi:RES family NAD+ phosphorylase [Sphingobium herbicidovorans]|uniref:RES family NAD+ phosphorylase n=1 Tax=Sphingobium herbicidovorans TaxID=76947 RepID=UPI001F375BE9|nr:RES family NAD+ phosphorylase [Sphingobium herbicidovorans]